MVLPTASACIDLIWTRSVHLLPAKIEPHLPIWPTAEEKISTGENTPNLARDVKVCIRGTNGQPLPVAETGGRFPSPSRSDCSKAYVPGIRETANVVETVVPTKPASRAGAGNASSKA